MDLLKIYYRMPVRIQNLLLSLYGDQIKLRRYNFKFRKQVKEIRKRSKFSVENMRDFQNKELRRIIAHAYENVPYYRRQMQKSGIKPDIIQSVEDLTMLPIITKSDIRKNMDQFRAANKKHTIDYPTGGTTGSPLIMKTNYDEIRYSFALYEVREKEEFGVYTGLKTAVFLGKRIVDPSILKPPYWRQCKSLNQTIYSVYHMNQNTLKYYVKHLKHDTPIYITGYVAPIYRLAHYMIANNISPIKIKAIFLSSETLHEWEKEEIEKAFLCKVCNGYSQAEGVAFISSCSKGRLHVNPDYGVVEFLPVENSSCYEIIGTTLFNYSMPLIRYRTGDYVMLDEEDQCDCGLPTFPIVKEIVGRDDSILKSPSGKVISSAALSLIFKHFPELYECQIIQEDKMNLSVLLHLTCGMDDKFKVHFLEELTKTIGNEFYINLIQVASIPKTNSGKNKLIISRL